MALVVESGNGDPEAEAYVDLAYADDYWAARASDAWDDASLIEKEAAIREATQYLDATYRWRGELANPDQALGWPRSGAIDREGRRLSGVPRPVRQATAELALQALSGRLVAAETARIKRIRERVDVIETEREYVSGALPGHATDFVRRLLLAVSEGVTGSGTVELRRG